MNNTHENKPPGFQSIAKYPATRHIPIRNLFQWLSEKRAADNVGHLWRVSDKLYDLSDFISRHPGGSDWISLSQGTDITEAFQSHHATNTDKVKKLLEKYYMAETDTPRNSPFTFEDDGFYMTLKRKAEPILQRAGTGPNTQTLWFVDFLCLLFLVTLVVSVYFDSYPLQIFCGYILAKWSVTAHNFFHFRDSFRKYYYDFSFNSSYEHRIAHVLSHHMYPNTEMDLQFAPDLGKCKNKVFFAFLLPLKLMRRIIQIFNGVQCFRWEHLIIFSQLALCISVAPSPLLAMKSWILIHMSTSYFYYETALGTAIHDPNFTLDAGQSSSKGDFGLLQTTSVAEFPLGGKNKEVNNLAVLTSFGDHELHHLFPAVCHSKLNLIKGVFRETLQEFKIK